MVPLLMNETVDSSQARTILQTLFVTEANILPDPEHGWLNGVPATQNASMPP